jgi:16S rRNA (cytosine967-C5)-methyltransferase
MPVSPARSAAFDILLRVERDGSYTSELLHSAAYERLSHPDHALTTELVMGVLRWRSRLDNDIATASSQSLSKLDLEVLISLRLALYQLHRLDRIPQHAAINESVELVKRARKRSAVPFVNAVLRKLSAQSRNVAVEMKRAPAEDLTASSAHPLWLVERWIKEYGLTAAKAICEHNQSVPTTSIRLRSPAAEAKLAEEGIGIAPGRLLASSREVLSGDVAKTKAVHAGQIVIQDEGSQLVAVLVLGVPNKKHSQEEIRILDCCAAPGGKTLAIADRNPDAAITAVELHPHRARLLRALINTPQSSQQSSQRISVIAADARHLPTTSLFDYVLADVPCSGTGTLARNPEIKWRLTPEDITELHTRQCAILRAALERVASNGRFVYSTCSLEKEENENVVEEVLADNSSFRVLDCRTELEHLKTAGELSWTDPVSLTRGPYLRTIPGIHPCDGFFAAILKKI